MSAREVIAQAISETTLDWEDEDPEVWEVHTIQADAILAALDAAGLAVVPKEPTPEMRRVVAADWGRKTWRQFAEVLAAAKEARK